jgi:hypothetical protein
MFTNEDVSAVSAAPSRISRRTALMVTFGALAIVYALWNVEQLSFLVYPFRLFVTYVHEAGHSLAALLSGGEIRGFEVYANGSGLARTAGGSRFLILPAGYLGAAFFGALLFYLVNRFHIARSLSVCLGVVLVIFSALYARPANGVPVALIVGLLFGLALIALGIKVSAIPNLIVLNVLAIMTALNAVLDLLFLIRSDDISVRTASGIIRNDAAAFSAEITRGVIPPIVWALLWAALAIAMIGAAVYFSLLQPALHEKPLRTPRVSDLLRKIRSNDSIQ